VASALRLTEEAMEFAASGVERALLLFRTVLDPLTLFNIHEQPLFKAEFWDQKRGCAICTDNMEGLCR